jgi:diguanylate cyclase (GGDEF)-like protein/PAS domain S-box-containing protein
MAALVAQGADRGARWRGARQRWRAGRLAWGRRGLLALQVASVLLLCALVFVSGRPDTIAVVLFFWGPPCAYRTAGRRFAVVQSVLIAVGYGLVVLALVVLHPGLHADRRYYAAVWFVVVGTVITSGFFTDRLSTSARSATERFRGGFARSVVGIVIAEPDGTVREANDAFCAMVRRSSSQLVRTNLSDCVVPDDVELLASQIGDRGEAWVAPRLEIRLQRASGGIVLAELDIAVVGGGSRRRLLYCQFRDITDARHAHDRLAVQARTDALTQLPNRILLAEQIRTALQRRLRTGHALAVMLLDLDRFKIVNDSFGHGAGDDLLVAVADRLRAACGKRHTVARLGGDEFVVVCEAVESTEAAMEMARELLAVVGATTSVRDLELTISTSIGVAIAPARPQRTGVYGTPLDPEDLIRHADVAMYQAKSRGGNTVVVFDDSVRDQAMLRLRTEMALRQAVREARLLVHYQPIVDLESGRWTGLEALVRWLHPERGLLSPGEFIGVAEESQLIDEVGRFVLLRAFTELAELRRTFLPARDLQLAVNVSVRQLSRPGFAAHVARLSEDLDIVPSCLAVEITESLLMGDPEVPGSNTVALAELVALRELGVTVLVDDFGTGFSSLSYLRDLPVDAVKVDRSFVSGGRNGLQDPAIVTAIVDLARALDLDVVAEGIETEEQWAGLKKLGCTSGQGYLFGHATAIEEVAGRMVVAAPPPVRRRPAPPRRPRAARAAAAGRAAPRR